jgi:hypothetical protein
LKGNQAVFQNLTTKFPTEVPWAKIDLRELFAKNLFILSGKALRDLPLILFFNFHYL